MWDCSFVAEENRMDEAEEERQWFSSGLVKLDV